jgi:hypothetical protein
MSTDTEKYQAELEREARHSAFEEFSRDERRPAVILLSALLLSAIFFAIGIMVGRWTVESRSQPVTASSAPSQSPTTSSTPGPSPQQVASAPTASPAPATADNKQRRFTLLVPDLKSGEAARSLVESLARRGYKDVRTQPRTNVSDAPLDILIGHYTREEAEAEATRLRDKGGPRMKNLRVIEEPAG